MFMNIYFVFSSVVQCWMRLIEVWEFWISPPSQDFFNVFDLFWIFSIKTELHEIKSFAVLFIIHLQKKGFYFFIFIIFNISVHQLLRFIGPISLDPARYSPIIMITI